MFFNPAHQNNDDNAEKFSFTGILVTLRRKSISHLLSAYYYPTTAFALLSMISYLIDPESVRFLIFKFKVQPIFICYHHACINAGHTFNRKLIRHALLTDKTYATLLGPLKD